MFSARILAIILSILYLPDADTLGSEAASLHSIAGSKFTGIEAKAMLGFIANSLVERSWIHSPEQLQLTRRPVSEGRLRMHLGSRGDKPKIPLFFLKTKIPRNILGSIISFSLWNGVGNQGMPWAHALEAAPDDVVYKKDGKKRILILLSDTGGGHKASGGDTGHVW